MTGAYPLDIDSDGQHDLAVLRVGENVRAARPRRLPIRTSERALGIDGGNDWTAAFSATWEGADAFRRWRSAATWRPTDPTTCGESRLVRPGPAATRYDAADRAEPRLLHAVDAVQRLEPHRPARPSRRQRPPLLQRRPGAALADRLRRATRRTRGRRLAAIADLGHGHRQPRRHRRRLSRGVPHEPGRQQAPDPRRWPIAPTFRDIALRRGVTAQRPSPVATCCRQPPGIPNSPM